MFRTMYRGSCLSPDGHNCIPVKRWFRKVWWCVRCDTWDHHDRTGTGGYWIWMNRRDQNHIDQEFPTY